MAAAMSPCDPRAPVRRLPRSKDDEVQVIGNQSRGMGPPTATAKEYAP